MSLMHYEEEELCCDTPLPEGVTIGHSRFGGSYLATCERCSFKCAYWECACELEHDCEED